MKLAVIIVNFNSGDLLAQCLLHLQGQQRPADAVIVVDNASEDSSLENLPTVEGLRLIRMEYNAGFAAANNRAIAELADTDYLVTLNPDAFPEADFISRLHQAAGRHPGVASFACRMMADENTFDGTGDCYHVSGLAWRRQHGHPYHAARHGAPTEVFSACAGAAMYRREALLDVGGFDEAYFCYFEDVDLGYRLQLAGQSCRYLPEAVVRHLGSAISNRYPGFAVYHGHRNLVWTLLKNTPAVLLLFMLPLHLAMTIALLAPMLWRGHGGHYYRAKRDAIAQLPRVMRQRRKILKGRKVHLGRLLRLFSVLPRAHS